MVKSDIMNASDKEFMGLLRTFTDEEPEPATFSDMPTQEFKNIWEASLIKRLSNDSGVNTLFDTVDEDLSVKLDQAMKYIIEFISTNKVPPTIKEVREFGKICPKSTAQSKGWTTGILDDFCKAYYASRLAQG